MKQRCSNPKLKSYPDYGGRGIFVCSRWLGDDGFKNFLSDMGKKPSPSHSIERKKNDESYYPDNCVWATKEEQCNNKRTTRYLVYEGKRQSLSLWAKELGIKPATLYMRLKRGLSLEDAIKKPFRKSR